MENKITNNKLQSCELNFDNISEIKVLNEGESIKEAVILDNDQN